MSLKAIAEDGALVPAPRNLPTELFLDFDRRDGDQIVAELMGGVVEEYAYQFKQGDQTVTGLSLAGVMAVAQNMGGITCGQPIWTITDDDITCDISATDHKTGLTVWGTATETKMQQTRNGAKPDKFARGKALSKAQRNAIRKVIPETVATKMLQAFLSGKNPSQLPRQQQRQAPPPPQIERPAVEVVTEDGEIVATGEPMATDRQIRMIFGKGREIGWTDDEIKQQLLERYGAGSSAELTKAQATEFIDYLVS